MTYTITLAEIQTLADALSAADGHVRPESEDKAAVALGHAILMHVLGEDVHLVYGHDDEAE